MPTRYAILILLFGLSLAGRAAVFTGDEERKPEQELKIGEKSLDPSIRNSKPQARPKEIDYGQTPSQMWNQIVVQSKIQNLIIKAEEFYRADRLQDSLDMLLQAHRVVPGNASVMLAISQIYLNLDQTSLALNMAERAHKRDEKQVLPLEVMMLCNRMKDDRDEVVRIARMLIKIDPKESDYHETLGYYLYLQGNKPGALKSYRNAIEAQPERADVRERLGNFYFQLQQHEDAINAYRRAIDLNPNYAETYNSLAIALMAHGKDEESKENFTKAINLDPYLEKAYQNLIQLNQRNDEQSEAIKHVLVMLEVFPNSLAGWSLFMTSLDATLPRPKDWEVEQPDPKLSYKKKSEFHHQKAVEYVNKKDPHKAARHYLEAILAYPGEPRLYNNFGFILADIYNPYLAIPFFRLALTMLPNFVEAHENLQAALQDIGRRMHGDQLSEFEKAVQEKPQDPLARVNLGQLYLGLNQPQAAVREFKTAVQLKPDDPELRVLLCNAYILNRNDVLAVNELMHAMELDITSKPAWRTMLRYLQTFLPQEPGWEPKQADPGLSFDEQAKWNYELGQFLERKKDTIKASHHLIAALILDHDNPEILHGVGSFVATQLGARVALPFYRYALHLDPKFDPAARRMAELEGQALSEDVRTQVAYFRRVVKENPKDSDAHFQLAINLAESGQLTNAVPHFVEAVKWEPKNEMKRAACSRALSQVGQHDAAITCFTPLYQAHPEDPRIQFMMASLVLDMKQPSPDHLELAVRLLQKALAKDPQPVYWRGLASAYAAGGKWAEAVEAAEKAQRQVGANADANTAPLKARIEAELLAYRKNLGSP